MHHNGRAGFTFIELMVVMAVAGLIATIAMPQIQKTMSSYRLSSSAQQLSVELNAARGLALSRVTATRLTVQSTSYQVIDTEDQTNPPRAVKTLEPGITFAALPAQPVRFFSRGHARPGAYLLEDEYGVQVTVTVRPSGMVDVSDMAQAGGP